MKILITGKSGYIASSLANFLKHEHFVYGVGRSGGFNLVNKDETSNWFKDKYFDVVLHTAICGGSRLKEDSSEVLINNLSMFFNLYENRAHFGKLITFGSGAEDILTGLNYYGRSKKIISDYVKEIDNFYSLKIYGVFDENELPSRFIKTCIHKAINSEILYIDNDRYMDFIYMPDFLQIVDHYIRNICLDKGVDCCYNEKYKLSDIAKMILPENKIKVLDTSEINYIGTSPELNYKFIGLKEGIEKTKLCLKQ